MFFEKMLNVRLSYFIFFYSVRIIDHSIANKSVEYSVAES